jgi:hypothetical protein
VSKISVASDSGRAVAVRGDIKGYVFALENVFPLNSLGEMGVIACMTAKAVGVSQVQDMVLFLPAEMPMFYVDLRLVVCVADASVRRGMSSVRSRDRFRARGHASLPLYPPSTGDRSGARISSDAALCFCSSVCTTTMLPAPTATFFLITLRHRVDPHRPDRGQCHVQGPALSLDSVTSDCT